MLTIIPPKSTSEVYCGVTSNHRPDEIITKLVGDIEEISKTNSTIEPSRIEATCMLDETGCITTDSSKAKSIFYQEVKDGKIVTWQERARL